MKKVILLFIFFTILCSIPAAFGAGYVAMQIFDGDYSKFEKSKILEILSKETILFYSDGSSQLGSLFGDVHRIYVPIGRIPKVMKDAIVSSEDENFYTNIGIDVKGIIRAAIHNLISRSRQGASTITQQTVKNLYGRKETDLFTKFDEMINAFKMERMYSKDQILEFYLNQFHVTGNGRGVGVASKYYFNKDVEDLSLVEAAFIAASVKGPEKYNPFTKITQTAQEKAKRDAMIRKNYVIERMYKDGKISKDQWEEALKTPVPFNQGRFQYNEISINQTVQKQLGRNDILQAIGAANVDEIGTMGLHITTTLDKNIQNAAQYGLRQNLSGMQMVLKGFELEPRSNFMNIQKPELRNFYVGRIESVNAKTNEESVEISFGSQKCLVDTESINRVAIQTDLTTRKGLQKSKSVFMKFLAPGQYVLSSVKHIGQDNSMTCDLESRPKIQGASLVLDKGKIIAMAGGFSSNEYNRALFAKRQPGSTFKIPTYYAALQMGWSVLDSLPNMRNVFPWQGNLYFPRPDHAPKSLETTILGAGAQSENLASIWLLEHMLDKLNYNQFLDLLKFLGIMTDDMSKSQVLSLIANKFNATPDNMQYLTEGALEKIKTDMATDLNIVNNKTLKVFIRTLHYGSGFDKQYDLLLTDKELTQKEQKIRLNALNNNLIHWNALSSRAKQALDVLAKVALGTEPITEFDRELLSSFSLSGENLETLVYNSTNPWKPELTSPLVQAPEIVPTNLDKLLTMVRASNDVLNHSNILLDGVVPMSLVDTINEELNSTLKDIQNKEPLERMFWNSDFRYSLGMYYTAKMVQYMGVNEPLQWIPSFPLGSNVVTLSELALMYQTFLNGKLYRYFDTPQPNQLLIIKRIEDNNGNLLWESKGKEFSFADNFYSVPILNTLRGTVTAGTAYLRLNGSIILRSDNEEIDKKLLAAKIRVPSFGKTGTTNNFTNGTYIGFLPYPAYEGDSLSSDNAYTIASYIGYDSNEPMIRKWFSAQGTSATPAWQEIALNIIKTQNYAEKLKWENLLESETHLIPFNYGRGLSQAVVPINSGISIATQTSDDNDDSNENAAYANDFTETGRHSFMVYLDGSLSDDVFLPKRKTSFFTPFIASKALEGVKNTQDSSSPQAKSGKDSIEQTTKEEEPPKEDDVQNPFPANPIMENSEQSLKKDNHSQATSDDLPAPPPLLNSPP